MPRILTERVAWTRPRPTDQTRRSSDLTPDEQKNVRRALKFLAKRLGGWPKLAKAMGACQKTVAESGNRNAATAGTALRAARVAGVPLEEILAGRWPQEGACPHCGRA